MADGVQDSELGTLAPLLRKIAATPHGRGILVPGTVISQRYTIESFLGRGGMGAVYEAHDGELDEPVALKLLHRELGLDAGYRQRLRTEVRLARRISHPNVCRVHDLGLDGDHLYVTMELVRGRSLRQLIAERAHGARPPLAATIDLITQIASALAAAHRVGVLHRDIKPDNVMLDGARAVLTDFGVASLAHDDERVVVGTPSYIAPEILRGDRFDERADVYSTAALAYELATGRQPFPARSIEEATQLAARPSPPPPLPATLGSPALREALDRVFASALAADPEDRMASMEQFAESIARAARAGGRHVDTPRVAAQTAAPAATATRRTEVRVATALVYRAEAPTAGAAEQLERIVVDAGGTPVAVSALEIAALFGVPLALGDDAERAIHAAQAMIARAGGRAGLDTVRVVLRPHALAPDEAFSSAAALADAAGAREILASALTARQIASRFEIAGVEVGGVAARRILGPRQSRPRAEAATFRPRQLAALVAMAEQCFSERRPRHGEIRARAGYGKTRLREALVARMRERRDIEWLVARADLYGTATPLGLLRAADAEWYACATKHGVANREATFAAARRWLEARSERKPIGLVFEDLQWADELSRELVDQLATSLDDVPVLILTFVRTDDDAAPPPPRPHVDVLALSPLDTETATALVRSLVPGAPREAVDEIVARAGGHPFFLEELARELAETGLSQRGQAPLPATIEAVVQARLDALAPTCRDLITVAAVMGTTFWRDALDDLAEATASQVEDDLAELERRALIAPALVDSGAAAGDRYRFVHELVREVAYARLGARERRAAHAAIVRWLQRRYPGLGELDRATVAKRADVATDVVAAFAHHLEQAGDPAAAAVAYRVAGLQHLEAAMYRDAARALERAASLLPAVDAELATALGDAVLFAESVSEAETWYERALTSTAAADDAGRALLWHKLGSAASRRADNQRALRCFEAGLALAAPDGTNLAPWALRDPRTTALLFGDLGWVAGYQIGDNQRGLPACERAVELLEGTPHRRELAHALSRLGATYMRASRFRDQLACNQKNLEIGIELADVMMQLVARVNLGVVHGVLGEIEDAIAHTEIARTLATRSGARYLVALTESNLAGLYLECGRLDDAQRCLDEALVISERTGRRTGLTESYGYAARLRAARGDLPAARRWASQALELANELALPVHGAIALRLLAQIHARSGDPGAALATIDAAAARLGSLDAYESARTEAARARILRLACDHEQAAIARARAIAALTELGARRELAVIDDLTEIR